MKKLATPTIALIAAALVIAALAGALAATAFDGDDEDRDDEDPIALATEAGTPAPVATPAAAAAETPAQDADDAVADADDVPLSVREADRVGKAAIAAAGGGSVTDLSRSDDPGEAYEVEVQTAAGEVDVALDADLNRVSNNAYDD
jgi:hypothetical protein